MEKQNPYNKECLGKECPAREYPTCDKGIPCCICNEPQCNSRQSCPAKNKLPTIES